MLEKLKNLCDFFLKISDVYVTTLALNFTNKTTNKQ